LTIRPGQIRLINGILPVKHFDMRLEIWIIFEIIVAVFVVLDILFWFFKIYKKKKRQLRIPLVIQVQGETEPEKPQFTTTSLE